MSKSKSCQLNYFLALGIFVVLTLTGVSAVKAQSGEVFNKRPFTDLAVQIKEKLDQNEVDLTAPFSIQVVSDLTKEGRLANAKVVYLSGDRKTSEIGTEFVAAVSDSNLLKPLSDLGIEKVTIMLLQDEKQVSGIIKSELETENKAKQIASSLNFFIPAAKQSTTDEDAKFLLANWKITVDGRKIEMNFLAPKESVQELVKRKISEAAAKKTVNE